MTLTLLPETAAIFMMIFARLGTMVMLMPGFGERGVPVRIRLSIAILMTLLFFPMVSGNYTISLAIPALVTMLVGEIAVGLVIGGTGRLLMSGLQSAGVVIANQLGLGTVFSQDPTQGQQGAIFSGFLSILAITLIFASDMHHLIIAALHDSYELFGPGALPNTADAARLIVQTVGGAFKIAIQISAPFLVFGLILNAGLGVLAKLMPQMQVFFIAMPITIILGLMLFGLVIGAMMATYLTYVETGLAPFVSR
ncbi:MAG: flagellar biosynthetic protein FliR [Labrys sp. (in: a-proteobacteria)]|jgi:flagellar biosynthetic protein FliR